MRLIKISKGFDVECVDISNQTDEVVALTPEEYTRILEIQEKIFVLLTKSNNTQILLDSLCKLAESCLPNSVASIMMKNDETGEMFVLSAPSIPKEGCDRLNGLKPGPGGGSCGNAVFRNESQFVANTFEDERWCDIRSIAYDFNICSCWSFPIRDENNNAVGSFALSSFEHRMPSVFHKKLLEVSAFLVNIVFKKSAYEEEIQESKEKLKKINEKLAHTIEIELNRRLQSERVLAEQSKFAAIKDMISMVAHHWRQPLTVLAVAVQDVKYAYDYKELTKEYIDDFIKTSMDAIKSMSTTIDSFRNECEKGCNKESKELLQIISETLEIFESQFNGYKIKTTLTSDPNFMFVTSNIEELKQILVSIVANAVDALLSSKPKEPKIDITVTKNGNMAVISIADNGGGIDATLRDRIFEPYFTTKESGVGTALYLAKLIAENRLRGFLTQENNDEGAVFNVGIRL